MNRGMPAIWESKEALNRMIQEQTDSQKSLRLKMLYLLQTGQARNRKHLAELLDLNRETVGAWMRRYESGGIESLLRTGRASGRAPSLPGNVIEALGKKLANEPDRPSPGQLVSWIDQTYGLKTTYRVVYYAVTKVLGHRLSRDNPKTLRSQLLSIENHEGSRAI